MTETLAAERILTIDIGGTLIKATILNLDGELQTEYRKVETPKPATPELLFGVIQNLIKEFSHFDRISVGFPGYVKNGIVYTAPQLNTEVWASFNFGEKFRNQYNVPIRLINDADLQGLGVVSGEGFEIVITLGTGLGSALLMNGNLLPHLELSQHPITKKNIYDSYIGAIALHREGEQKWNTRVKKMLAVFKTVFNYDHLYIGGGNAGRISFPLDKNISIVSNQDGIKGGARLWHMHGHKVVQNFADNYN